jgi:hypothetical protein
MSDLLRDIESRLSYRMAFGEAARLVEIARFDHASGRDAAARVRADAGEILAEVSRRMGGSASPELIELAVNDVMEGRRLRW